MYHYSYSSGSGVLQLLLLGAWLIPLILFLLTQHRTLEAIRPEFRLMAPGQVWLQLIPIFGLVWQFIVITKIADSLRNALNEPVEDSIFGGFNVSSGERPTYTIGIAYAICVCCFIIPFLGGLAMMAGLVCFIIYWVQLVQYKNKLGNQASSYKNTL
jgi:hypothetical protein